MHSLGHQGWGSRRPARRDDARTWRRRHRHLAIEPLEPRHVLASIVWIGGANGAFDLAENWSDGAQNRIPGEADTAVFTGLAGYNLTINGTQHVGALDVADGNLTLSGSGALIAGATTLGAASMLTVDSADFETTNTLTLGDHANLQTLHGASVFVGNTLDLGTSGIVNRQDTSIVVVGQTLGNQITDARAAIAGQVTLPGTTTPLYAAVRNVSLNLRTQAEPITVSTSDPTVGTFSTASVQTRINAGARGDVGTGVTLTSLPLASDPPVFLPASDAFGDATLQYVPDSGRLELRVPVAFSFFYTVLPGTRLDVQASGQVVSFAQVAAPNAPFDLATLSGRFTFVVDSDQSYLDFDMTLAGTPVVPQAPGSLTAHFEGSSIADFVARTANSPPSVQFLEQSLLRAKDVGLFQPGPSPTTTNVVHVLRQGVVTGAGVVQSDVLNDGVVQAGGDGSPLTILGNYTQSQYGLLKANVRAGATAENLAVTGAAQLDSILEVTPIGDFSSSDGSIPLLTATAGISGNFNQVRGNRATGAYLTPVLNAPGGTLVLDPIHAGVVTQPGPDFFTSEAGHSATLRVKLNSPPTSTVTVTLGTSNAAEGLAANALTAGNTLTFDPTDWDTFKTVHVAGVDDALPDGDVGYFVNLHVDSSDPAYTGLDDLHVPIVNRDDEVTPPTISIADASASEGDDGSAELAFAVSLSAPSSQPVTVSYATRPDIGAGAAVPDVDYQPKTDVLTFPPNSVSQFIKISVIGDRIREGDEHFSVVLSNPQGATLDRAEASGTIVDDDPLPTISISDPAPIPEGDSADTQLVFTVTLSNPSADPVSVHFATSDGSATADSDYAGASGVLTLDADHLTATIPVTIHGDTTPEADETFHVTLSDATGATIGTASATGVLLNDDLPQQSLSIDDVARYEADGRTTQFVFHVALSQPAAVPVSVHYATSPGTATEGTDFQHAEGTLRFAPNEVVKTIAVNVTGDLTSDASKTFRLTLSNPQGATLARSLAIGTILNLDTPPVPDPFDGNPNNSPGTATPIALPPGQTEVTANISAGGSGELVDFLLTGPSAGQHLPGDWDFYRIHLDQPTTLRVEIVAARDGSPLDPVLSLLMERSGHVQMLATDDDTIGLDPLIQRALEPGDYIIGVAGAQGTRGQYRLQIDRGIAPQIIGIAPDGTVGASPSGLTLFLNEQDLDAQTILQQAFHLVALDQANAIAADLTAALGPPRYDPTTDRLTIPLLHSLLDGRYQLRVDDSIRSSLGIALDGDDQQGAGGNYVATFAIDTTPPELVEGSLDYAAVAGADGIRYRLSGRLTDAAPAATGQRIDVQLDVDGDGQFDDGDLAVLLAEGETPFTVYATRGLPPGGGDKTIQIRLVDAVGNVSAPASFTVDTNRPTPSDAQPPTLGAIRLTGDTLASSRNFVKNPKPTLLVDVADPFPTAAEQLVVDLDSNGDGQFDDGHAVVVLNQSAKTATVSITLDRALPEGTHVIGLRATDAAGLQSAISTKTLFVDRTGPTIRATQVAIPKDSSGNLLQTAEIRITLNEELDPSTAEDLRNYLLVAAGGNDNLFDYEPQNDHTSAITSIVYTPHDAQQHTPPSILVTADLDGLPADEYQLMLRGQAITDIAGNALMGGNFRIPFQFNQTLPRILSVTAGATQAGQAPHLVVVGFNDVRLQTIGVENIGNYQLVRVGSPDIPLAITAIHYDPLTNQALLTTADPLSAGSYRLTVFTERSGIQLTGIASASGLAVDGDRDGTPGGVATIEFNVTNPRALDELLQSQEQSVVKFATQVALDASAVHKSFASVALANQLLDRLQADSAAFASPQALAAAINQQVAGLLTSQWASIALDGLARQGDFLVIWGRSTRFLLASPNDGPQARQRIGVNANGLRVEEISGAVLVEATIGGETFSVAIVPTDSPAKLASSQQTTVQNHFVMPSLIYQLQLEGLAAANEAGIVVMHAGTVSLTRAISGLPVGMPQNQALDLSEAASAFDPDIELINNHLRAGLEALFGPLDKLHGSLLFGWLDPVDYVLSQANGDAVGARDGVAFQDIAGSFSATNSGTSVVVMPNSLGGPLSLDLFGLGTAYRGAFNFAYNGSVDFIPLQGLLDSLSSVSAVIAFRSVPGSPGVVVGGGGGTVVPVIDFRNPAIAGGGVDPRVFDAGQTVATASVRNSLLSSGTGLLSFLNSASSLLSESGGPLRLSDLASHVGRQGLTAAARQLRLSVLRSLRSIRAQVPRNADKVDVDELIAEVVASDPENIDSFFSLEPKLEGFVQSHGGQDAVRQFEQQLRLMRALRGAIDKLNQQHNANKHGPLPQGRAAGGSPPNSVAFPPTVDPPAASARQPSDGKLEARTPEAEAPSPAVDAPPKQSAGEFAHADES